MEEEVANKAKENLSKAGQGSQISVKVDTQKELAKAANVSHDTIYKIKKIESKADDRTKEKLAKGEVTINSAPCEL